MVCIYALILLKPWSKIHPKLQKSNLGCIVIDVFGERVLKIHTKVKMCNLVCIIVVVLNEKLLEIHTKL